MASLSQQIQDFVGAPNAVLFAGAGVGARVGLPDWNGFMRHLGEVCTAHGDALSAALIKQKVEQGDVIGAGTVYKACRPIPLGERLRLQALPFVGDISPDMLSRLVPLVGLGFSAIVTTNYDTSLHRAYVAAGLKYPTPAELDDGSLRGAALRKEHYIARVHGRAQMPETMVFADADYERLRENKTYLDFLLDLLKVKRCLFVGFSFVDPALAHVLDLLEISLGPNYPSLHAALVPKGSSALQLRLSSLNIQPLVYDPADNHRALWQTLREAYEGVSLPGGGVRRPSKVTAPALTPSTHRFMAFAYAQLQTRGSSAPITVLVKEGIVLSTIAHGGSNLAAIEGAVRANLGLTPVEAAEATTEALGNLVARGDVLEVSGSFSAAQAGSNPLSDRLDELADGLLRRMRVRERIATNKADRIAAAEVIEGVLMARAWDIAAHFAGAAIGGWSGDLPRVIEQMVNDQLKQRTLSAPGAMTRALVDLIRTPEDREAELLAELSRVAFGVQIVLSTPRQALFQKYVLPQRMYLDANIVLPAITAGYPLKPVYADLIQRLRTAATQAGVVLKIVVGSPFAEEVLSHKKRAEQLVKDLKLDTADNLSRHIGYYTATNTNVFIGGYASFVGRSRHELSFRSYLSDAAPYDTFADLVEFLDGFGIDVEVMDYREIQHSTFRDIYNGLLAGYEGDRPYYERKKETVLIVHEAQQLTKLRLDAAEGLRSIFVTADARLRRVMQGDSRLHDLLGATITDLGLVALVDVMIGLKTDPRSLARLVWAVQYDDAQKAVMDYFVMLALREYDVGIAMQMQELASKLATQAVSDAKDMYIDLLAHGPEEMTRTAEFLDRYENRFFRAAEERMHR